MNFLQTHWRELLALTGQHLWLVVISVTFAVVIGIPVGIALTRHARWKRPVLGVAGILQTVPSLALFGFLIPLPFVGGIGARTAIVALILYALLPIIRNTVTGIEGVDANVRESATAMGMTSRQILWQVELPLATSVILAGVRVAAVICVGVATIAAAIGADGLGVYIFRGLRMNDNRLVLAGAIPAALMALSIDWLIGRLETRLSSYVQVQTASEKDARTILRRRIIAATLILILGVGGYALWRGRRPDVIVGTKDFTESVILGEILAQSLEARGLRVGRHFELGGNICHDALNAGEIDVYPEYTGTSFTAILKHQPITDPRAVYQQVAREYAEQFNVEVSPPLGFSNDFAILVRGRDARALNLRTISDAASHTHEWRAGFGQDFVSRPDGYEGFSRAYNLQFRERPREMDLSLTYRALAAGEIDLIAGNSTDGLIGALDLVQLEDDRHYFPPYQAVFLTRRDALARTNALRNVLQSLSDAIPTEEMRRLNYEVDGNKRAPAEVVREWRQRKGL
ncbi:MAG: osmoprotectant transport system substrate-binding protein opuBD [Acidobacteriota bacterium]|nr:osmoprotectant transport system substrate-binding protein opuBD [Acidobacteriota bacterium]